MSDIIGIAGLAAGLAVLSILIYKRVPAIIAALCAAAFILCLKCSGKKNFSSICAGVMAGTMLINGVCGYAFIHEFHSVECEKDGLAVQQLTEGKPYIYLLSGESAPDYGTDVNAKEN